MQMFRRIFMVALLAGLFAGAATTALQVGWAVPLILKAETYESSAPAEPVNHVHADGQVHVHDADAWAPEDGLERTFWTTTMNILLGVGGGLLIAGIFSLRRKEADWRVGLGWGAAAFAAVSLSPALGLPPELPGTAAAELTSRQGWWWFAVIAAAVGIACVVYGKGMLVKAVGVAIAALPHLIGAPHPAAHEALAPAALQHEFIAAALVSAAIFWLALGLAVGFLASKFTLAQSETKEETAAS
jgi:cobalt transporter subunit CbtA